ncbi:MAG TPA: dienelactone hydrolase family protein [Facklamia tabacinasalis]|nr:dienelactone hydrolase family protein [Ruoffia tabacinasalis]
MKLNEIKDAKYYEGENKETGIILFHAYTGSPNDVNLLARELNRSGYGVLCPKFEGHATKDVNDILDADITTWKQQALDAVEAMQGEYDRILVFGLSLGGIFATWLMTQPKLDVQGGGVFNSPVYTENPIDVEVHFTSYVKAIFKRFSSEDNYNQEIDGILTKHRDQIKQLEAFKSEFQGQLENIDQPFFIAQSGKDEMINEEDAEKLQNALVNAKVDFNWFPENTHVITVNRNRKDFEAALFDFITSFK